MSPITVYLAGPITRGNVLANINQALALTDVLKNRGFSVYCPHWGALQDLYKPWEYEEWMAHDFVWLAKCDTLFRMKGDSLGADREVVFAQEKLIPVFYEEHDGLNLLETWRKLRVRG